MWSNWTVLEQMCVVCWGAFLFVCLEIDYSEAQYLSYLILNGNLSWVDAALICLDDHNEYFIGVCSMKGKKNLVYSDSFKKKVVFFPSIC